MARGEIILSWIVAKQKDKIIFLLKKTLRTNALSDNENI